MPALGEGIELTDEEKLLSAHHSFEARLTECFRRFGQTNHPKIPFIEIDNSGDLQDTLKSLTEEVGSLK